MKTPVPTKPAPPAQPAFWNERYASGRTPWDFGAVPAALARFLAAHPGHGTRVLAPGCGSGHEIAAFAHAGYAVTAIDFSPVAVALARANVGPALANCVIEGDFFTADFAAAPFDLIYERTFLCALPPDLWPKIVGRLASLLRPGGTLAGIYFFGAKDDGPPFGLAPDEPARLFDPPFITVAEQAIPATESLPLFAGSERWQERKKKTAGRVSPHISHSDGNLASRHRAAGAAFAKSAIEVIARLGHNLQR